VGRAFAESQFWAEVRAVEVGRNLEHLAALLKPNLPRRSPTWRPRAQALEMDLAPSSTRPLPGASRARRSQPRAAERPPRHRARRGAPRPHPAGLRPAPGRELHLAWQDELLFAASTRERLTALIDRYEGAGTARLDQDPGFKSVVADLPSGDRALLYVDLSQVLSREPWSRAAPELRRWLPGEPRPLPSRRTRVPGPSAGSPPDRRPLSLWAAELASVLGKAEPLGTPAVTPKEVLAFGGLRFSPERLRERLSQSGGPVPDWLAPLKRLLAATWSPAKQAARSATFRERQRSASSQRTRSRRSTWQPRRLRGDRLGYPGRDWERLSDSDDDLGLRLRHEDKNIDGVHLTTRTHELLATRAFGYGLHRGWLFGGDLPAAEGVAKALAGARWEPSALAREVFSQPAQLLGWVDGAQLLQALRRAAPFRPWLAERLRELGRLPEALIDAGGVLRLEANRICAQAFVRYRTSETRPGDMEGLPSLAQNPIPLDTAFME